MFVFVSLKALFLPLYRTNLNGKSKRKKTTVFFFRTFEALVLLIASLYAERKQKAKNNQFFLPLKWTQGLNEKQRNCLFYKKVKLLKLTKTSFKATTLFFCCSKKIRSKVHQVSLPALPQLNSWPSIWTLFFEFVKFFKNQSTC